MVLLWPNQKEKQASKKQINKTNKQCSQGKLPLSFNWKKQFSGVTYNPHKGNKTDKQNRSIVITKSYIFFSILIRQSTVAQAGSEIKEKNNWVKKKIPSNEYCRLPTPWPSSYLTDTMILQANWRSFLLYPKYTWCRYTAERRTEISASWQMWIHPRSVQGLPAHSGCSDESWDNQWSHPVGDLLLLLHSCQSL